MERLQEITREIALQDIQTLYRHTAFWMEQNDLTQIVNAYFDYRDTGLTPEEIQNMLKAIATCRENVKKLNPPVDEFILYSFAKACEQIAELDSYKQSEQDGLMVRLPCKIGTKLWHIYDKDAGPKECYASENNIFLVSQRLGTTVFLTKEDADKALKGGNGE